MMKKMKIETSFEKKRKKNLLREIALFCNYHFPILFI